MMSIGKSVIAAVVCCSYLVSAQSPCITSCTGLPDGDYQSCKGCRIHVTCVKEVLYDNRPCFGGTVWDDSFKRCLMSSETCQQTSNTQCVTSCTGLPNGDYQSCNGCGVYATCLSGFLLDNRPCGHGLVFNANTKRCDFTSPTCN